MWRRRRCEAGLSLPAGVHGLPAAGSRAFGVPVRAQQQRNVGELGQVGAQRDARCRGYTVGRRARQRVCNTRATSVELLMFIASIYICICTGQSQYLCELLCARAACGCARFEGGLTLFAALLAS